MNSSTYTKNKSYTFYRDAGIITGSNLNQLLSTVLHLSMSVIELGLSNTKLGVSLYDFGFTKYSSPASGSTTPTPTPTPEPTPTPTPEPEKVFTSNSEETEDGGKKITVTDEDGEVAAEITLSAEPSEGKAFTDVTENDWFSEAVDKATACSVA